MVMGHTICGNIHETVDPNNNGINRKELIEPDIAFAHISHISYSLRSLSFYAL